MKMLSKKESKKKKQVPLKNGAINFQRKQIQEIVIEVRLLDKLYE